MERLKYLDDRYEKVYTHKGYDICILKKAVPGNGDSLNYRIDDGVFAGQQYECIAEAICAIEAL